MDIGYFLENPKGRLLESHVRKRFPDEYPNILQYPGKKWAEKLYNYLYGCPEHNCVVCGKPTNFRSFVEGYSQTCSPRCGWHYGIEKAQETIRDKYGVDNISQLDSIKQKKKQTMIDNYGSLDEAYKLKAQKSSTVYKRRYGSAEAKQRIKKAKEQTMIDNYGSLDEAYNQRNEKSRQTKFERYADENYNNRSRATQTKLDRYGNENYVNIGKIKQTFLDKYGAPVASMASDIKGRIKETNIKTAATGIPLQKRRETCLKLYGEAHKMVADAKRNHPDLISSIEGVWTCACTNPDCTLCSEKTYQTDSSTHNNRQVIGVEQCTKLNPIKALVSQEELSLKHWLEEIGVEYTSESDMLHPKKLDIYIPSKKLAIEYNGVYWHSDACKPKRYHMDKYKACEAGGVQLIQIWSDWWLNKPEAVKSVILSKLGIYNNRVGARQCYIKEVSASVASQFENEYHLQGSTPSKYKLGLYYKDELVSLMTFGKARTGMSSKDKKEGEYELIRYCCKSGWQVVGGASKLFKHFIQLVHPTTILSFSSNDISNGSLYKNLGFTKIGETVGYWYIDRELNRYHRYTFNKYNIAKRGWAPAEGEWTERSVMDNLGFYRIWDSGQTKWLLQILLESPTN